MVEEVPVPLVRKGTALVRTSASLVSAGTERMLVDFAEKSLLGKAASRPDLVRQVITKAQREGCYRHWKQPSTNSICQCRSVTHLLAL